jgi:DNA-binding NarL/FixJ family response regulator
MDYADSPGAPVEQSAQEHIPYTSSQESSCRNKRHSAPENFRDYSYQARVAARAKPGVHMQHSNSDTAILANGLYGTRKPSPRQRQVIELVAQGLKNSEVADAIGTTEHVVKNHLRVIYDKLGLWNRVELALWFEARRYEDEARRQHHGAMA